MCDQIPVLFPNLGATKQCLRVNLLRVCILGLLVPQNIAYTYVFLTQDTQLMCGAGRGLVHFLMVPLLFLFGILYPFLVKIKLDKFV